MTLNPDVRSDEQWNTFKALAEEYTEALQAADELHVSIFADRFLFYVFGADPNLALRAVRFALHPYD